MKYPQIHISYNQPLTDIYQIYLKHAPHLKTSSWQKWQPVDTQTVLKKIISLKNMWEKYGPSILKAMCEITEIEFKRSIIDIYVVNGCNRSYASPIIVHSGLPLTALIDLITHELIHVLLNDYFGKHSDNKLRTIMKNLYPNETGTTYMHIIVYSIYKYIVSNVFDKEHYKIEIVNASKHKTNEYSKAWEYIEKEGHLAIIKKVKHELLKK